MEEYRPWSVLLLCRILRSGGDKETGSVGQAITVQRPVLNRYHSSTIQVSLDVYKP